MENKDMVNLLEKSILPLMAEMIKAMGEHSYRYENHIKSINEKVGSVETSVKVESETQRDLLEEIRGVSENTDTLVNRGTDQEEVLTILTKTITTFGERLTSLIDTNNRLIDHQKVQSDRMEDVIFAFEENTARLNTLTLAIRDTEIDNLKEENFSLEDPLYDETLQKVEGPIEESNEIQHFKEKSKPIHKVLEEEIAKLKGNE